MEPHVKTRALPHSEPNGFSWFHIRNLTSNNVPFPFGNLTSNNVRVLKRNHPTKVGKWFPPLRERLSVDVRSGDTATPGPTSVNGRLGKSRGGAGFEEKKEREVAS